MVVKLFAINKPDSMS